MYTYVWTRVVDRQTIEPCMVCLYTYMLYIYYIYTIEPWIVSLYTYMYIYITHIPQSRAWSVFIHICIYIFHIYHSSVHGESCMVSWRQTMHGFMSHVTLTDTCDLVTSHSLIYVTCHWYVWHWYVWRDIDMHDVTLICVMWLIDICDLSRGKTDRAYADTRRAVHMQTPTERDIVFITYSYRLMISDCTLGDTATHYNALQHTATQTYDVGLHSRRHCNTPATHWNYDLWCRSTL